MGNNAIAIQVNAKQYRVIRNDCTIAFINQRDSGGWWVNPMMQRRPSRRDHESPQAAAKSYGLKISEWTRSYKRTEAV